MSNRLEFSLGMKTGDFTGPLTGATRAYDGFLNKTQALNRGLRESGGEVLGMRERVEVLRNSLDSIGGPLGRLSDLSRLALDPMTVGFAAVFGAVEIYNYFIEKADERNKRFVESAGEVNKILHSINSARKPESQSNTEALTDIAKANEHLQDYHSFWDGIMENIRASQEAGLAAQDQDFKLKKQGVDLLVEQGQISRQEGARRVADLERQAILLRAQTEQLNIQRQLRALGNERAGLQEKIARQPDVASSAIAKSNAESNVADLTRQIEDLPKAIAAAQASAREAQENSNHSSTESEAGMWTGKMRDQLGLAQELSDRLDAAKAALPGAVNAVASADENVQNSAAAKARVKEINDAIQQLTVKLTSVKDSQKQLLPGQLAAVDQEAAQKTVMKQEYKFEPTQFEKMGFIMSGGNPAIDYQRRTAIAAERTANQLAPRNPAAQTSMNNPGMVNHN